MFELQIDLRTQDKGDVKLTKSIALNKESDNGLHLKDIEITNKAVYNNRLRVTIEPKLISAKLFSILTYVI